MNIIKEYLKELKAVIDRPDILPHVKAMAYHKHESVANEHGIVTESELETIKLELKHCPPETKDELVIQQAIAIEKLLKQVSDLQAANGQLYSECHKHDKK
jgi:hypothetical protein